VSGLIRLIPKLPRVRGEDPNREEPYFWVYGEECGGQKRFPLTTEGSK
jgi:hypothetical protein